MALQFVYYEGIITFDHLSQVHHFFLHLFPLQQSQKITLTQCCWSMHSKWIVCIMFNVGCWAQNFSGEFLILLIRTPLVSYA
jgi:hypothetical protein